MLKRCNRCRRELPLSDFQLDRRGGGKYGRQGRCRACTKIGMAEYHQSTRLRVLRHYSGGSMRCACCGESEVEFLGIDHIDGDGAQHRREVRPSGIYRWLIKNKFPSGIQILCTNCNLARGFYGTCPHQESHSTNPAGGDPESSLDAGDAGSLSLPAQAFGGDVTARNDPRNAAAVTLSRLGASKGGHARAASLSPEQRLAIAKKAAAARWPKKRADDSADDPTMGG
jgi:hypothetical protein